MKYDGLVEHVKSLIERSAASHNSADTALKYSQAALNAAHAIAVLENTSEKRD